MGPIAFSPRHFSTNFPAIHHLTTHLWTCMMGPLALLYRHFPTSFPAIHHLTVRHFEPIGPMALSYRHLPTSFPAIHQWTTRHFWTYGTNGILITAFPSNFPAIHLPITCEPAWWGPWHRSKGIFLPIFLLSINQPLFITVSDPYPHWECRSGSRSKKLDKN